MTSTQCELYLYTPSLALAIVAVILFSTLTTIHIYRMIESKAWFGIFFVLGGLAQLVGYTARSFLTQDVCDRGTYGVQSVALLMGPTLIMFSVNLTQSEFVHVLDAEQFCWLPLSWQRGAYPTLNVILMVIQLVGGCMTVSSSTATVVTGTKLTIALYVIQTIFWGFTMAENIWMSYRLGRHPTAASSCVLANWKMWNQLIPLAGSIIATGRNVMRLTMAGGIEFLVDYEWPSYAFDGYQMVVVLGAWGIWYLPGKCRELSTRVRYTNLTRLERVVDEV
ncbi:uncharacterized protein BO88DRAFT_470263 [Aspergillus vadensis CBS 113365]|uniref:RTA1 domain protein n=1 Tax=Aspergillus vadensis (strain CBS 113365 / IMI 142717 / IBT 24658) TaxID=1448311 RepID=A0A319BJS4_ASPVC|nr:hypothetical protein BO88DRAFT_470263 [Aspergillus vadensis CBS 113365]PYH65943.1 hypothetical protein BO88DRAFT_470263 [Aspergillus vadensis CBS 113365]